MLYTSVRFDLYFTSTATDTINSKNAGRLTDIAYRDLSENSESLSFKLPLIKRVVFKLFLSVTSSEILIFYCDDH